MKVKVEAYGYAGTAFDTRIVAATERSINLGSEAGMGKVQIQGLDLQFVRHRYLVANRTEAQFYEGNLNGGFRFLKRISNPEGRIANNKLLTDRPGRVYSSSRSGVSHGHEHNLHEERAKQFAQKICQALDDDAAHGKFSDLVILAEPHFLGLLNQHCTPRVKSLVRRSVAKEWARGSDQDLEYYLREKMA